MQNKYVGDVADFAKYLLLKNLVASELKLGVNWCLTNHKTDADDGKHTKYLENESNIFFNADQELFRALKGIVKDAERRVAEVTKKCILAEGTIFYGQAVESGAKRFAWHKSSLEALSQCDVIFFDPDNGLEVASCGKLNRNAVKYVYFDEVLNAYELGKSLVIYQHGIRSSGNLHEQITQRRKQLSDVLNFPFKNIDVFIAPHGSAKYFLLVKHPNHAEFLNERIKLLKGSTTTEPILTYHKSIA